MAETPYKVKPFSRGGIKPARILALEGAATVATFAAVAPARTPIGSRSGKSSKRCRVGKIERLVSGWDNPAVILKATKSVRGSGNIYRDFDVPDADFRQLKAALAAKIIRTLDKKGLSVRKAQSLTGIDAEEFSSVRKADFRRISVERLMAMLNGLGLRVEVVVKVKRTKAQNLVPALRERLRRGRRRPVLRRGCLPMPERTKPPLGRLQG